MTKGTHQNKRFQAAYDKTCDVTQWSFRVLYMGEVETKREVLSIEAEYILDVPAERRLNMPTQTTTTRIKHRRVIELLKQGRRYVDIRDEVGMSLGMISNIKKDITEGTARFSL